MVKFRLFLLVSLPVALGMSLVPFTALSGANHQDIKAAAALPCETAIRIMPLGDSITTGSSSGVTDPSAQISYRMDLWKALQEERFNVDFVGSRVNGVSYQDFDPDHEGHSGYADHHIAFNIYNNGGENWLGKNHADIILLHIGTNGLDPDPSDVEDILDEIDEYEADTGKHVTVLLARIVNRIPATDQTTEFNDAVQTMVEARDQDDVIMANMETGAGLIYQIQPAGDMWDYLHPYSTGYAKMAALWKSALDPLLESCRQDYQVFLSVVVKSDQPTR